MTGAEDNPGALPDQMTSRSEPEAGSRNAGADPLALRDDLRMVRDMVQGAAQLRYAGQFLASIGRALGDDGLASAALRAARAGDRKALFALADARDPLGPVL